MPSLRIVAQARRRFLAHGFTATKRAPPEVVIADKLRGADTDLAQVAERSTTDFPAALPELRVCVRSHAEELQPTFLRDITRDAPALFKTAQQRRRALLQRCFDKLLNEGRKNGMIRTDINTTLMIEILLGATDALMTPAPLADINVPAGTCLTGIISVFLAGVTTDKARKRP